MKKKMNQLAVFAHLHMHMHVHVYMCARACMRGPTDQCRKDMLAWNLPRPLEEMIKAGAPADSDGRWWTFWRRCCERRRSWRALLFLLRMLTSLQMPRTRTRSERLFLGVTILAGVFLLVGIPSTSKLLGNWGIGTSGKVENFFWCRTLGIKLGGNLPYLPC